MMNDRRYEPRRDSREPIELHWADGAGPEETCTGLLRDVSRSGAGIQLARPVRLQTLVRLTVRNTELKARVKSCIRAGSKFVLGLQFEPEFQGILQEKP
jgi:hypothetical protein